MSDLVRLLYPLPEERESPLSIVKWWESRRPAFNVIVGATGLFTVSAVGVISSLWPNPWGVSILQFAPVVLAYGVMANVCYSGLSLTEIMLRKLLGDGAPRPGPALWRMALTFSVGLTLFPIAITGIDWVIRFLRYWLR